MLEIVVNFLYFPEGQGGKVTVAAPVTVLGRTVVILSVLVLALLRRSWLVTLVAQPVRLVARLSVPRLDETWQKRKSPKSSFESHFRQGYNGLGCHASSL